MNESTDKYYLLLVTNCSHEIELEGPFATEDEQCERAEEFWEEEASQKKDDVFALTINDKGKPVVEYIVVHEKDEDE